MPFVEGGAEMHVERSRRRAAAAGLPGRAGVDTVQVVSEGRIAQAGRCLASGGPQRSQRHSHRYGHRHEIPHVLRAAPNKVTWLFHQYRAIYDLCGTAFSEFAHIEPDVRLRDRLIALDNEVLSESKRLFTNARNTATRLAKYNGLQAEPLYHPPPLAGRLRSGPFGDYVLSVGRLEGTKRVDLIIRALARSDRATRLVIAGEGPLRSQLEALASAEGVRHRVTFTGALGADALVDLYAGALAIVFPPFDEDYGYVTLEAFLARKPVVTTTDAGGPLEFVEDRVTGFVTTPNPDAIGAAIAQVAGDHRLAQTLGDAGFEQGEPDQLGRRRRTTHGRMRDVRNAGETCVVIPAFNEAAAIASVVSGLRAATIWHEILVVDDGSHDDTGARAQAAGARVVRHPYNKGNGAAVKTGIRSTDARFVLIVDADGQHRPDDAARLVAALDPFDLVVGARAPQTQAGLVRRSATAR